MSSRRLEPKVPQWVFNRKRNPDFTDHVRDKGVTNKIRPATVVGPVQTRLTPSCHFLRPVRQTTEGERRDILLSHRVVTVSDRSSVCPEPLTEREDPRPDTIPSLLWSQFWRRQGPRLSGCRAPTRVPVQWDSPSRRSTTLHGGERPRL